MRTRLNVIVFALLSCAVTPLLFGQSIEDELYIDELHIDEQYGQRCVNLSQLKTTRIVNNQSILFYLNRKKILINQLPYRCRGLSKNDSIMFKTSTGRLCSYDSITVLDSAGSRFLRGARCGLGLFYPITKDQVAFLTGKGGSLGRNRGRVEAPLVVKKSD